MDQDSFRLLLQAQKSGSFASSSGSNPSTTKLKTIDSSQPAFKPRKVKKTSESKYRDRAAERRHGGGNDYAEVEAVLEEFEKRNADNENKDDVEQKRKYLGGDSEHSILVKGLDMALLEANKAKATVGSTEDDDMLEEMFTGTPMSPPESNSVPKKRTREEIVRELKEKRGQAQIAGNSTAVISAKNVELLEEAKKTSKFKPIGFRPIAEEKPKKKMKHETKDGERKKKKQKVDKGQNDTKNVDIEPRLPAVSNPPELPKPQTIDTTPPEPDPLPEEFNIFADVGEYEGLDLGEEEEEDSAKRIEEASAGVDGSSSSAIPRRWVEMDEDDLPIEPPQNEPSTSQLRLPVQEPGQLSPSRNTASHLQEEGEVQEEEKSSRLRPLESSALPSIKEFLALQEAADAEEKRKKRKEKKRAKTNK